MSIIIYLLSFYAQYVCKLAQFMCQYDLLIIFEIKWDQAELWKLKFSIK